MSIRVNLQLAVEAVNIPKKNDFKKWIAKVLQFLDYANAEISVRIVDTTESAWLNKTYRQKNRPTNVLSFPFEMPNGVKTDYLGDLAICASVVEQEATDQNKTLAAHWAHLVIHGTLHLLGYDHQSESDAEEMEGIEINILNELGFSNPYEIED